METPKSLYGEEGVIITKLNIEKAPKGKISKFLLNLVTDGMGIPIYVPIIVARGKKDGITLGLTAAIHGNELNGIPVIQRIFNEIDIKSLKGTIVGVPVLNVPSLIRKKRRFIDGTDLNHIMPGKEEGNVSQVYAFRLFDKIIKKFDYLIDLHTASFGRINSYYIRADMKTKSTRKMALLQNAQIIVHNPPSDGTLRGAAEELGIAAITLEVGDPNRFQKGMIRSGLTGIHNVLHELEMIDGQIDKPEKTAVICKSSYWIYTDIGGILTVHPNVTELIKKGQVVATMRSIFGDVIKQYYAPEEGIVIGKSSSPINQSGGRIIHLGIIQ